jgi:hypothetical protein
MLLAELNDIDNQATKNVNLRPGIYHLFAFVGSESLRNPYYHGYLQKYYLLAP